MYPRPPNQNLLWAIIAACKIMIPAFFGMIISQFVILIAIVLGLILVQIFHLPLVATISIMCGLTVCLLWFVLTTYIKRWWLKMQ